MMSRYPNRFETYRLEPIGEPAYLDLDDARGRYERGAGLSVVEDTDPPGWYLEVSPRGHRFTVTFYTSTKTPLRVVTWERDEDELRCRRILDIYYPDGDPGHRVPYVQLTTVTQQIFSDGVVVITLSSSSAPDELREVTNAPLTLFRTDVPAFGEWAPLLLSAVTDTRRRFGPDAFATAASDLQDVVPFGLPSTDREALVAGSRGMSILTALADPAGRAARTWADIGSPVVDRGASAIFPLASAQAEARGAMERLHAVRDRLQMDAIHFYGGDHFHAETDLRGEDGYARNIARSGIETVGPVYAWRVGGHAAVLVHGRDSAEGTETLALHVVPADWVWEPPGAGNTKRGQSRRRRAAAERDAADASWTWPERRDHA
ncbi:hypothetical protein CLV49_2750 [Labedella gwakjiensis]|uniref:Uncharacterized protein n=1 Tax=Labedella gwakjiensis TaxID=390269 RepID=A0A2P8GYS2_9MICO|nr:hypothetical protein [Labedella gwakjiensis]PSL39116.1 hypothetical protein CLV49_2750 [Labedella gwakjiensis]RUQ86442.1 hypothetical protein ELQ93_05485 [Labedella gwakjiensis]